MKKYFFSLVYPACSLLIYFGVLRFFSPDHRESFYLISISMGIMVIGEGLRATIISRSNDPENFFSSTFMFSSFLSYVIFCLCLLYYSVSVVGLVHAFAISFLTSLYGLRVFLRVWFDINKEFFVLFAMGSVRVAFASMVFLGFLNDINGYVIGLIISRSLEISVLCFFSYKKISRFRVFFDKKNCLFLIKSISERLVFSFRDLLFGYIIANAPSGVSDLVFLAKRMSDIFSDSFGRILESMIARYEYGKSIFLFFCVSFVLSPFLMSLDLFLRYRKLVFLGVLKGFWYFIYLWQVLL